MRRGLPVAAMLLGAMLSAQAQGQPVATDPPAPSVDEVQVERGDTLWDITARVVGDPFQWPRIWSYNPEITNPHWIYPGDIIRFFPPDLELPSQSDLIAGTAPFPDELEEEEAAEGDVVEVATGPGPGRRMPEVEVISFAPRASAAPGRRFLRRFVTPDELEEAGRLTNAAPDKILLNEGDLVFLEFDDGKRPGPGTSLVVYQTVGQVRDPGFGWFRGYLTQITGLLEVVSPTDEEVTRARVTSVIYEMERGQYVAPLEGDLRVLLRPVATSKKIQGTVMAVREEEGTIAGDNDLVFIDKGKKDGLELGNRLRVLGRGDRLMAGSLFGGADDQRYEVGLLQVVDTRDSVSTCLVIRSLQEIEPGAEVETVVDGAQQG